MHPLDPRLVDLADGDRADDAMDALLPDTHGFLLRRMVDRDATQARLGGAARRVTGVDDLRHADGKHAAKMDNRVQLRLGDHRATGGTDADDALRALKVRRAMLAVLAPGTGAYAGAGRWPERL